MYYVWYYVTINENTSKILTQGGQKNLQTKADRKCEQVIRASLMSKYPNITLIGEEDEPLDPASDANAGLDENVAGKECPDQYKGVKEQEVGILCFDHKNSLSLVSIR